MATRGSGWGALVGALIGTAAMAQSASLLEQVRGHDPLALQTAASERDACAAKKGCPDAAALQLLTGYLALSSGDAEHAQALLATAEKTGVLAPFSAYYRGEAAFYAHHLDDAVKAYAEAAQTGPAWLQTRARHREAEALVEAQGFSAALPLLSDVTAGNFGPELLWAHQVASRSTGDVQGADTDCHTLSVQFPRTQAGADALALIGEGALTPDERLSRAEAILDGGAPLDALEALDGLEKAKLPLKPPQRAQLALLREQAFYALGKDKDGDRQAGIAARGPSAVAAQALFARAKRQLKKDDHANARVWLARIEQRFPKEPQAEQAGYLIGWIDLQDKKYPQAIAELGAFGRKHGHSRKRDEALWFRALAQIDVKDFGGARKTLEGLVKAFPTSSLVPQALYWTYRSAQLSHAASAGVEDGYAQLIQGFPGSYYALLAAVRLQELGHTPPQAFPDPPKSVEVPLPSNLTLAAALTHAGLFKDAAVEIASQTARVKDRPTALALGEALQGLGDFGAAYSLAARVLWGAAFHDRDPKALALIFPQAYRTLVTREAQAQSVDPSLLWAVMRRESAFDPTQISGANARGLLQLVPPTGAAIAHEMKLPPPAPDALLVPEENVKLSAWYLAQLVKRFAHPVLCAAAYNAGPSAVVRWMKMNGKLPLDLFVEQIPYKETRGYVKQVVADLYNYHALYGGPGQPERLSLTLPEPAADGVQF